MKSIIVEDSRLARQELKNLLAEHTEVQVLAEASHAEEARQLIESLEKAGALITFCEAEVGHKVSADCLRGLEGFFAAS